MKEVNKKRNIIVICLVILVVAAFAGISYAYFAYRHTSNPNIIIAGNLELEYTQSNTVINLDSNTTPILDEDYESEASQLNFTVKNIGDVKSYSTIKMNVTYIDGVDDEGNVTSAKTSDYKWALKRNGENVTTGTFADGDSSIIISNMEVFDVPKKTEDVTTYDEKTYTLYVWASETWADQSSLMGTGLQITIEITKNSIKEKTLISKILGEDYSNIPNSEYNTDFTCNEDESTCTRNVSDGIYKSTNTNNSYPTYYYKGEKVNNYVKFGSYLSDGIYNYKFMDMSTTFLYATTQDIIWRIVRINEDGSIRLISEDINSSTDTLENNATNLQTFYDSNLTTFADKISIQNYCIDEYGYSYDRATILTPTFKCDTSQSNYAKYGNISIDEIAYSGAYIDSKYSESKSYMNNGTWFYTTSNNTLLNPVTNLIVQPESLEGSSRIVINLKTNQIVSSGKGTKASPWIIK